VGCGQLTGSFGAPWAAAALCASTSARMPMLSQNVVAVMSTMINTPGAHAASSLSRTARPSSEASRDGRCRPGRRQP